MYKTEKGGAPEFFMIKDGDRFVYYQYVRRDISAEITEIEPGRYYDIITTFDHGGYYYNHDSLLALFFKEFEAYAIRTNIISEFVRFLPTVTFNYNMIGKHMNIRFLREQIYIDIAQENYVEAFNSSKKDNLRKAENNRFECMSIDDVENFLYLYKKTIERRMANDYFLFEDSVLADLVKNRLAEPWYVLKDEVHISGCILLKNDSDIYYFMAASDPSYLSLGASTFLIYSVAEYYKKKGKSIFFLGGGQNGVYEFKRGFSKCRLPYYIGYNVYNKDIYNHLVNITNRHNNDFFPKYREKII
jgi:lipid II:glycine glycyltransferase (peptidoglycan interpeptide bridge formation enzyme)